MLLCKKHYVSKSKDIFFKVKKTFINFELRSRESICVDATFKILFGVLMLEVQGVSQRPRFKISSFSTNSSFSKFSSFSSFSSFSRFSGFSRFSSFLIFSSFSSYSSFSSFSSFWSFQAFRAFQDFQAFRDFRAFQAFRDLSFYNFCSRL